MPNPQNTVVGWILLAGGVVVIAWTLFNSYQMFTGATEPPALFAQPQTTEEEAAVAVGAPEELIGELIGEQLESVLPIGDDFNTLLNLTAWSLLAFLLIIGGSAVAGLGVKLLK